MTAIASPRLWTLTVTRVVVCFTVLTSSEVVDAQAWARGGVAMQAPPAELRWALPLLHHWATWVVPLQIAAVGTLLSTALGLGGRAVRVLALAFSGALFALPHFSGGPRHSMHLIWFLAVLALGSAGRPLLWARQCQPVPPQRRALEELTLLAARCLLACVYFFPGLWKLRESGIDWILSDNLLNQMHWKWYQFGGAPEWRIDRYPRLVELGAFSVVVLELCFPLLLLRRWSRALAAGLGLAFHLAADAFLFLPFSALFVCYTVLIDWDGFVDWLHDGPEPAEGSGSESGRATGALGSPGGQRRRLGRAVSWRPVGAAGRIGGMGLALLVAAAGLAGLTGRMRGYPFACYPTFQWRAGLVMPDLWIAIVQEGREQWLPDSPAHGGRRSQAQWAMAWKAAGVYGDAVSLTRLRGYYESLSEPLRERGREASALRFYRASVRVDPAAWGQPPAELTRIGHWPRAE